jgi:hypothetical protein
LEFDGFNVPAGYHVVTRPRIGLVIGGAVTLGVFYMLSVSAGTRTSGAEGHWLAVPLIGPFGAAGAHEDACEKKRGTEAYIGCIDVAPTFEIVDGLGQIVGASLLFAGLISRKSILVPDAPYRAGGVSFAVLPRWTRSSSGARPGLSISGTF